MKPGIIRLSKKVIIKYDEIHPDLKQLWDAINGSIEHINSRRSSRLNWNTLHFRDQQNLQQEATEYGQEILRFLRDHFPIDSSVSTEEKELKVEMTRTQIHDFSEEKNSLVLYYYLITEQLTFLGNIADLLLIGKKEFVQNLQNGQTVENTFTINLNNNYDIVEYSLLKLIS